MFRDLLHFPEKITGRVVCGGWAVWAIAHQYFGRLKGAALLLAHPDFQSGQIVINIKSAHLRISEAVNK